MFIIGLTGGIGTGKSCVSKILLRRNYAVIDADIVARQVAEPGRRAYKKIRQEFGDQFFDDDEYGRGRGPLNRERLAEIIFSDREKRRRLEAITHPEIIKAIIWAILYNIFIAFKWTIFLDMPLLYETNADNFLWKVVVVTCDESIQIARVMSRDNIIEAEARKRIKAQMPLDEKVKRADLVIKNNACLEELEQEVIRILAYLQEQKIKITTICIGGIFTTFIAIVIFAKYL